MFDKCSLKFTLFQQQIKCIEPSMLLKLVKKKIIKFCSEKSAPNQQCLDPFQESFVDLHQFQQ